LFLYPFICGKLVNTPVNRFENYELPVGLPVNRNQIGYTPNCRGHWWLAGMPTTRTTPVGVPANRNYCHVATICYAPIRFADLHCVLYNCNMQRITDWYNTVVKNWKEASKDEAFKFYFALNFVISFGLYFATIHWVKTNSTRTGTVLDDPLYHLLAPRDFSLPIFILTYSPVVPGIYSSVSAVTAPRVQFFCGCVYDTCRVYTFCAAVASFWYYCA
jgi:hypothetical protein